MIPLKAARVEEASRAAVPRWTLTAPLIVLWGAIGTVLWLSLTASGGHIVYALDDPYIHMAMAKNLAQHGVWGVTPDGFTSSSSSIAWTAGLALLFRVFGVHDVIPLVVNIALATGAVWFVHRRLSRAPLEIPALPLSAILIVLVLTTPLPALVFAGQEHVLHVLCTIAFVLMAADFTAAPNISLRSAQFARMAALAGMLPLVRYEGLYPVIVAAAVLLVRRRVVPAAVLVSAAAVPVSVYAVVSLSKGWFWAPNSVLLKGNLPDWRTLEGIRNLLGYTAYSNLLGLTAVGFLVYGAIAVYIVRLRNGFWNRTAVALLMFVLVTLLHLQYSQPRAFWLFRYEAYTIALGIVTIGCALFGADGSSEPAGRGWRRAQATVFAVLLLGSPLLDRAIRALIIVPQATTNIFQQQYQMGRFLEQYYAGEPVALNDIGAPTYLSGIRVLDLVGLASIDVARMRREGMYDTFGLDDAARQRGVRIAIVYDTWFPNALPPGWIKAASWKIDNPVVVGSHTVSFYATQSGEAALLMNRLRRFESSLPEGVQVRYAR